MSQNDFNNSFKEKLAGHSSDIDHNALWSDIAHRVPQKKKKRRALIWWYGTVGIGLLLLPILYFTVPFNKKSNPNQIVESSNIKKEGNIQHSDTEPYDKSANLKIDPKSLNNTNRNESNSTRKSKKRKVSNTSQIQQNLRPASKPIAKESLRQNEINKPYIESRIIKIDQPNDSKLRFRKELNTVLNIPLRNFSHFAIPERGLLEIKKKKHKRISPKKNNRRNFFQIHYALGLLNVKEKLNGLEPVFLNDGIAKSSQSISLEYGYFLTDKFYAKAVVNLNISTNKFTGSISRDTVVPSSSGEQILATNIYVNGAIDTENGIPEVQATINRSVQKLNRFQTINLGLGVGYTQKIGNLSFLIESAITKSIIFDVSGLGIEVDDQRIKKLASIDNYYSTGPIYFGQFDVGLELPIAKGLSISMGGQYQHGFSNMLNSVTNRKKAHHSIRAKVGIRRYW